MTSCAHCSVSADGETLRNVILFRREPGGQLTQETFADSASQVAGQWQLENTTTYFASGDAPAHLKQLVYNGTMRFANTQVVTPEEMPMRDLATFAANDGFGVRPAYVYQLWWQKRLTPFLVALVMVAAMCAAWHKLPPWWWAWQHLRCRCGSWLCLFHRRRLSNDAGRNRHALTIACRLGPAHVVWRFGLGFVIPH